MNEEKKIKVGTLTFHQSDNYGAVLQAYALQQAIINLGYETEIINYYSEGIAHWNSYTKITLKDFHIKKLLNNLWKFSRTPRKWRFNSFRKKLHLSQYVTKNTINSISEEYDCYIVGSDQVWNCNCTFGDYIYFLDFVKDNKKRNSYAASFAYNQVPKKYIDDTVKNLKNFNSITVREDQGCKIVYELIGKNAIQVLDPVFLLDERKWMNLISTIEKKYIFVYQAEKSPSLIKFVKKLSLEKKMPIYIVSTVLKGTIGKGIKDYSTCGPEKFLSLLKNAEYVVTNSFHGTALSIIFNKTFYVETLKNNNTNSRVYSILRQLDLLNRIIPDDNEIIQEIINYQAVNDKIQELRKSSINQLTEMIHSSILTD